jgi:Cu/Ag efflux protein CusF
MIALGAFVLALVLGTAVSVAAEQTKGTIKSVDADKSSFVITDENKKDWTLYLAKDGKVLINDKAGKLEEVKAGDEVTVAYERKEEKLMASEIRCKRN